MGSTYSNRRILLLGGRGMLGTELAGVLGRDGREVVVRDLPELDICDFNSLELAVRPGDAVVNCAAFTDVDGAETESALARAVNADAVGQLGRIALAKAAYVLHFSTDFVFDGALSRPYREGDSANPLNVYGETKLAGERALLESGCSCCVVRLQWTYGSGGENFVTKMMRKAEAGGEVRVVDDQFGAPTWTLDVAGAVIGLLEIMAEGVFHFAASGSASRFEVAEAIFRECASCCRLVPCSTSDFLSAARRPLNSRFDCSRIDALSGIARPPWQDSLEKFLKTRR